MPVMRQQGRGGGLDDVPNRGHDVGKILVFGAGHVMRPLRSWPSAQPRRMRAGLERLSPWAFDIDPSQRRQGAHKVGTPEARKRSFAHSRNDPLAVLRSSADPRDRNERSAAFAPSAHLVHFLPVEPVLAPANRIGVAPAIANRKTTPIAAAMPGHRDIGQVAVSERLASTFTRSTVVPCDL